MPVRDWDKMRRQDRVKRPPVFYRRHRGGKVPKAKVKILVCGAHRAEWRQFRGQWGCWKADEGLAWMIGMPAQEVKLEVARRGLRYRWERPRQ